MMHQKKAGGPFETIAIDIAGPFLRARWNRYRLIAMDYIIK